MIAACRPEHPDFERRLKALARPKLIHTLDCFSWDRVLWGSDWPDARQTNLPGSAIEMPACYTLSDRLQVAAES